MEEKKPNVRSPGGSSGSQAAASPALPTDPPMAHAVASNTRRREGSCSASWSPERQVRSGCPSSCRFSGSWPVACGSWEGHYAARLPVLGLPHTPPTTPASAHGGRSHMRTATREETPPGVDPKKRLRSELVQRRDSARTRFHRESPQSRFKQEAPRCGASIVILVPSRRATQPASGAPARRRRRAAGRA